MDTSSNPRAIGATLEAVLSETGGAMPEADALEMAKQLFRVLPETHSFIPGGFTPEHIIIRPDGSVILLNRPDVQDICRILYRAIEGRNPAGTAVFTVPVSENVRRAVMQGLSVSPEDRWQTPEELASQLFAKTDSDAVMPLLDDPFSAYTPPVKSPFAPQITPPLSSESFAATGFIAPPPDEEPAKRHRKMWIWAAVFSLLAGAGVLAFFLLSPGAKVDDGYFLYQPSPRGDGAAFSFGAGDLFPKTGENIARYRMTDISPDRDGFIYELYSLSVTRFENIENGLVYEWILNSEEDSSHTQVYFYTDGKTVVLLNELYGRDDLLSSDFTVDKYTGLTVFDPDGKPHTVVLDGHNYQLSYLSRRDSQALVVESAENNDSGVMVWENGKGLVKISEGTRSYTLIESGVPSILVPNG